MGSNGIDGSPILTARLALEVVPEGVLRLLAAGRAVAHWGALPPGDGLEPPSAEIEASIPAAIRVEQLDEDPSLGPWLARLIVLREARKIVGTIGGHGAPDHRGMVEVGYTVDADHRRQGIATEATRAWFGWAHEHGGRVARLSMLPDNAASHGVAARLGFAPVGREWDEVDQVWEDVLEAPLPLPDT